MMTKQNNGLQIVSVFDDNAVYAEADSKMKTIEFKDIKSLDFTWIVSNNIIQAFGHDDSLMFVFDNADGKHNLGQAFQAWLDARQREAKAT